MIIYINGERIELTKEQLDYLYLGEGQEGVTYIYKDKALKIYKIK